MPDYASVPAAFRFVGGRRRFNRERRECAEARRRSLVDLVCAASDRGDHVTQRQLARALRVHEATISRDLDALGRGLNWRMRITWGRMLKKW